MGEDPAAAASPPPNSSTLPPPVPLQPAVAPSVQLGFTILYTVLYAGLFLVVYVQLWLLYLYRHKRWSYQSIFLFLCLLWAALRTVLFSFYFHNAVEANHLHVAAYWLLYCFPVCLQFFTLSLINLYFTQVRRPLQVALWDLWRSGHKDQTQLKLKLTKKQSQSHSRSYGLNYGPWAKSG